MVGAFSFLISLALTPPLIFTCRRLNLFDRLSPRKIHRGEVPRLGGVSVFIASLSVISVSVLLLPRNVVTLTGAELYALLAGGILYFLLGFADDLIDVPAITRFALQILVALIVSISGVRIRWLFGEIALDPLVSVLLTTIWIVGMVNAINFIDGLDGLAGGISAIALFAIVVISMARADYFFALLSLAVVGALLGFLPFNFFPAKMFLGDGGAMFLGYVLSALSVVGFFKKTALIVFLIPLLLLLFPIADTAFAIARRLIKGSSPTVADKKHIHHRLLFIFSRNVRRKAVKNGVVLDEQTRTLLEGLAHRNSVLILYGITAILSVLAIFWGIRAIG